MAKLVAEDERELGIQVKSFKVFISYFSLRYSLNQISLLLVYLSCDFTSNHSYYCHFLFSPRLISLMNDLNY